MAALRAQTTGYEGGNATLALVAGDLVIVTARERDGSALTVSDSINGAYATAVTRAAVVARAGIWYFRNSGAGTANFTVTGGSVRDYNVSAWSGMQDIAVDTTNNAGSTSTSHPHGSVTPSASALIITAMGTGSHGGCTADAGNGFTALDISASATADRQHYSYKLAHTGAVNPTPTTVNSVGADRCVAAFLETGGGGGGGTGQPAVKRLGGVPHTHGGKLRGGHRGGVWGRSTVGLYVPRRFAA